ncbi:hypothetical protein AVEN_219944-1 [Araneus ventricosus]|uniref:Uncharacterized protein n=1 Tax=Araneus ventricosus TaxID=182803 RepID=A0A4Y2NAM5_ARAVE|nr:hypothetical protein AVEN_219944-1 [Araneus ventricosus]
MYFFRVNDSLSSVTPSQSQDSSFDQTSCSSCSPSKCDPQESSAFDNNIYQNVDADNLLYEIPPPPSFFTSKRYSDPLQQCSIYQNVSVCDMNERKDICYDSSAWRLQNSYIPMLPANSCDSRPQPPAKPPRKSLSPHSSETKNVSSQRNSYEFLCLATSGLHDCSPKFLDRNKNNKGSNYAKPYHKTEYVDMSLPNQVIATYENHDIICANGLDVNRISSGSDDKNNSLYSSYTSKFSEVLPFSLFYEDGYRKGSSFNNLMPSKSTPALHASRHTLDQVVPPISKEYPFQKPTNLNIVKNRASVHIPSSPTNYDQPPTPDNPPPSPGTAEIGIHEKIHPARQANQSAFALHDYHLADPQYLHSYQIGASNFSSRCQSFKSSSFQPDVHFEKSISKSFSR